MAIDKRTFSARLPAFLESHGLCRVHPDAREPVARAALEALAGLPPYDQIWVGDQDGGASLLAITSGERLNTSEVERRTQQLFQRAPVLGQRLACSVHALQLLIYERQPSTSEREQLIARGRKQRLFGKHRVGTWLLSLDEPPALHAGKLPGWPQALGEGAWANLLSQDPAPTP